MSNDDLLVSNYCKLFFLSEEQKIQPQLNIFELVKSGNNQQILFHCVSFSISLCLESTLVVLRAQHTHKLE